MFSKEFQVDEIFVDYESEFEECDRRVIDVNGLEIGVFRVKGSFYAYESECAHQGGPVCQGIIYKRVEENLAQDGTSAGLKYSKDRLHIVCPWHGYEYDLETGIFPTNPKVRLRKFNVSVRDGKVFVLM